MLSFCGLSLPFRANLQSFSKGDWLRAVLDSSNEKQGRLERKMRAFHSSSGGNLPQILTQFQLWFQLQKLLPNSYALVWGQIFTIQMLSNRRNTPTWLSTQHWHHRNGSLRFQVKMEHNTEFSVKISKIWNVEILTARQPTTCLSVL